MDTFWIYGKWSQSGYKTRLNSFSNWQQSQSNYGSFLIVNKKFHVWKGHLFSKVNYTFNTTITTTIRNIVIQPIYVSLNPN